MRFGFFRHRRKIKIEGDGLNELLNKCIENKIAVECIEKKDSIETFCEIRDDDFQKLRRHAGHRWNITSVNEQGVLPAVKRIKQNISIIAGALLLSALIFYQSMYVSEIEIDGYSSLSETEIRKTLQEAGLFEGVKKPDDYGFVKDALYQKYDKITWVSVYENGQVINVSIAEGSVLPSGKKEFFSDDDITNIIAKKSGMIEKIMPLQGDAMVKQGDYVNRGDVLIKGGGDLKCRAKGQVYAKVPRQLNFYIEKYETILEPTGRFIPGIHIRSGKTDYDSAVMMNRFSKSEHKEVRLIELSRPLPVYLGAVKLQEVKCSRRLLSSEKQVSVAQAAVRQYEKKNLEIDEMIIETDIKLRDNREIICVDAFAEIMENVGEEIPVKSKSESRDKKIR